LADDLRKRPAARPRDQDNMADLFTEWFQLPWNQRILDHCPPISVAPWTDGRRNSVASFATWSSLQDAARPRHYRSTRRVAPGIRLANASGRQRPKQSKV